MNDPTSPKAISDLVLLSRCRAAEALGLNLSPSEVMTLAALATERDRLVIENARLQDALGKVIAIARAALERESHAPDPRVTAQLAEARVEGWRRGIEAAAQTADDWFYDPEADVVADTRLSATIRALPLPADLGVRHE